MDKEMNIDGVEELNDDPVNLFEGQIDYCLLIATFPL